MQLFVTKKNQLTCQKMRVLHKMFALLCWLYKSNFLRQSCTKSLNRFIQGFESINIINLKNQIESS